MNSMACRIFRLLRKLSIEEGTIKLPQISTIQFGQAPQKPLSEAPNVFSMTGEISAFAGSYGKSLVSITSLSIIDDVHQMRV